jgi:hypothetical protein
MESGKKKMRLRVMLVSSAWALCGVSAGVWGDELGRVSQSDVLGGVFDQVVGNATARINQAINSPNCPDMIRNPHSDRWRDPERRMNLPEV